MMSRKMKALILYKLESFLLLLLILETTMAQRGISTTPSVTNGCIATGFTSFAVRAQFARTSVSATCVWNYPGRTTSSFIVVVSGITCNPVNNPPVETVSCTDDGTDIISELTILQPLSAGNLDISVVCDTSNVILTLSSIAVQECMVDSINNPGVLLPASTTFTYDNDYSLSCATGLSVTGRCQQDCSFSQLPSCTSVSVDCIFGTAGTVNGGDVAIIVIFTLVCLVGIIVLPLIIPDNEENPVYTGSVIAGFVVGGVSGFGLIIGYCADYAKKCRCYGASTVCLSGGEAAGVAISCLISLGAILAVMISYRFKKFCFKE